MVCKISDTTYLVVGGTPCHLLGQNKFNNAISICRGACTFAFHLRITVKRHFAYSWSMMEAILWASQRRQVASCLDGAWKARVLNEASFCCSTHITLILHISIKNQNLIATRIAALVCCYRNKPEYWYLHMYIRTYVRAYMYTCTYVCTQYAFL